MSKSEEKAIAFGKLCNKIAEETTPKIAEMMLTAVDVSFNNIKKMVIDMPEPNFTALFAELALRCKVGKSYISNDIREALAKYDQLSALVSKCYDNISDYQSKEEQRKVYSYFQLQFEKLISVEILKEILPKIGFSKGDAGQFTEGKYADWGNILSYISMINVNFCKDNVSDMLQMLRDSKKAEFTEMIDLIAKYEKEYCSQSVNN